uniref:Uncharacterized protein n=1 Tax=Kwoniella pini CBS 10737 TaxID=1296096 RepID=A0A1B9I4Y3_9TREE|nr:uncharacterized protein I206_03908 [Kwoniella pini CBS 10737]OCF50583.1 hypothetical protein I206_03908 [Kwoniella pini CBS 10737]
MNEQFNSSNELCEDHEGKTALKRCRAIISGLDGNSGEEELMDLDEIQYPEDQSLSSGSMFSHKTSLQNDYIDTTKQQDFSLISPLDSSSLVFDNANVHINSIHSDPSVNTFNTSTDNQATRSASSPSIIHSNSIQRNTAIPHNPSFIEQHALDLPSFEADIYIQANPRPLLSVKSSSSLTDNPPISRRTPISQSTPNNRPVPLRLGSSSASSSAASIRSARRLNQSPYIVPQTAKPTSSGSSSSYTMLSTGQVTVKDEPRTPVPLPSSPLYDIDVKQEDVEDVKTTPKLSLNTHSASRIGSSPGSMSMSHRRGSRPDFPPRLARQGSNNSNGKIDGSSNMRGLLTPLQSASSSSRQPPYPSPIPLTTAPLSPPPGTGHSHPQTKRYHQSPPSIPLSTAIPSTPNGKGKQSAYQVSLDEIPKDFVIKKLIQLASKYWYAPHSTDCHITIPPLHQRHSTQPHVPQTANNGGPSHPTRLGDSFFGPKTPTAASIQAAAQSASPDSAEANNKPDVLTSSVTTLEGFKDGDGGRRGSLPGGNQLEQCLVFPLHKDYLTTQSVLFRTLLNSQAAHLSNPHPRDQDGRLIFQSPVIRGAKVLPTKSDRPKALYVPLPDPSSFGVILHWLYWHDIDHFNHCLSKGLVTWQGVIRNIEYLSLDNEIKLLAGKWWKRWVKPTEDIERKTLNPKLKSKSGSIATLKSIHRTHQSKRRAFSTSAAVIAKRDKLANMMMNIDHDEDEDEDDLDDEENGSDSGEEADDEDIVGPAKKSNLDGFADNVSLQLGNLTH